MQNLKIAILQSDLIWHNPKQNRANFLSKIHKIKESVDVIILPEMFTTGFSMQPQKVAESMQGETVSWMQKLASEKQSAVVGSCIIFEENEYYNRLLFVHPSGKIQYYNKRHLFTLAGEHKVYKAGTEKLVVNYNGFKICTLICYDLRFPVWARNVENYDVLVYVANWPKPRISAWDALLKARAIENLSYVVGVNRVGVDANNLEYNGNSGVYDCLGEKLTNIQENIESTTIITLSKTHILETRKKLNFLNDKDSFTLLL